MAHASTEEPAGPINKTRHVMSNVSDLSPIEA